MNFIFYKSFFCFYKGWKIYRYVECTSAAIQGLVLFTRINPRYKRKEILRCINKAVEFIEKTQLPDGSWWVFSSWSLLSYMLWFPKRWADNFAGTGRGECASPTRHGLGVKGCWLLAKHMRPVFVSERLVISFCPNNFLVVGGERATSHAKTKYTPIFQGTDRIS